MSVFVLVHGGFYGGWGWAKVARMLRAAGHDVFSPTLTGFGERSHLLTRETGLHTRVQDIINVLTWEELNQVIFVGHSYGSIVNAGVLEKEHRRIARMVCVDGFIPKDGQSNFDSIGPEMTREWPEYARERGDGWLCPPLPNLPYTPPRWQRMTVKMCTDRLEIKNPPPLRSLGRSSIAPSGIKTSLWPPVLPSSTALPRKLIADVLLELA